MMCVMGVMGGIPGCLIGGLIPKIGADQSGDRLVSIVFYDIIHAGCQSNKFSFH